MTTIFDKILKNEIPSDKVYEDEDVYAFKDVNPAAPVHILVIPKRKVEFFHQLKDEPVEYVGQFFKKVSLIAHKLGLEEAGYKVLINDGKGAGQTVDYLHAHIMSGGSLGHTL